MTTKNEETLPEDVALDVETVRDAIREARGPNGVTRGLAALSRLASAAAQVPGLVSRVSALEVEKGQVQGYLEAETEFRRTAESERDALKESLANVTGDRDRAIARIAALEMELRASEEASGMYAERSGRFAEQADRLEKDLTDARRLYQEEWGARRAAEIDRDAAREQLRDLSQENERLTARVAELEQKHEERKTGLQTMQGLVNAAVDRAEQAEDRVAELERLEKVAELHRVERDAARANVERMKARATAAEGKVAELMGRRRARVDPAKEMTVLRSALYSLRQTLALPPEYSHADVVLEARIRIEKGAHPAPAPGLREAVADLLGPFSSPPDDERLIRALREVHRASGARAPLSLLARVRTLSAAYDSARAGSPAAPVGLLEAARPLNPENFLGPSLCRRLRKADMAGQPYTLDAQEVAGITRLLATLHERLAAYDAAKGGEAPGLDSEKARKWDAAVERAKDRAGLAKAAHDAWGSDPEGAQVRWVLYGDTPPSGPGGGERLECQHSETFWDASGPCGLCGADCEEGDDEDACDDGHHWGTKDGDLPSDGSNEAHCQRCPADADVLEEEPSAPLTPESLAAVVEEYAQECEREADRSETDGVRRALRDYAVGAREGLRRALAGNAPRVLREERVVEVLREHVDCENVGPQAFDEGWADCVSSIAQDLGLTLPRGEPAPRARIAPTPQPEGPAPASPLKWSDLSSTPRPAPHSTCNPDECLHGVPAQCPVFGRSATEPAAPEGTAPAACSDCDSAHGHGLGCPRGHMPSPSPVDATPAAPEVVWEGEETRSFSDGSVEWFDSSEGAWRTTHSKAARDLARALAEAKREAGPILDNLRQHQRVDEASLSATLDRLLRERRTIPEEAARSAAEAQRKACANAVLAGPCGAEETRGELHARVANVPLVTG